MDSRIQIGSVGKLFCAAAILLLANDGLVDLDEPVTRWYPESRWTFSVRHLLSHTSGLGNWRAAPGFDVSEPIGVGERIALFQQSELQHEPGRGWIYSSPGYVVLGDIASRASGLSYADLLTRRIINPLGLPATTAGFHPQGTHDAGGVHVPHPEHLSGLVGTGDIWSTTADIARFLSALHSGHILPEGSLHAMLTVRAPLTDRGLLTKHGYALGVYAGEICGRRAYFHAGDHPGYVSFAGWLPETRSAIVVLGEAMNLDEVLSHLISYATGV